MALQRTRRPRFRSGHSLRSLGSPLNARPLGGQGSRAVSIIMGLSALVASGGLLYGSATMSAAAARRQLMDQSFKVVTNTGEIPHPVIAFFTALTKTDGAVLAEPRAKYQETDVISQPGLPWRRLIFAGIGKGLCVLHYEKGGRGHSQHVAVFELVPGRVSLVWRAVLDRRADDLMQLRAQVRRGEYRDDPSYSF